MNTKLFQIILATLVCLNSYSFAKAELASATVSAKHIGNEVTYYFTLTNLSTRDIATFSVGLSDMGDNPRPTIYTPPSNSTWSEDDVVTPGKNTGPALWYAEVGLHAKSIKYYYTWQRGESGGMDIKPNETAEFSLTLPKSDPGFLNSAFSIGFSGLDKPYYSKGRLEVIDSTPPTLTLQASPNVIWPPNNKLIDVLISATTQDDIDPNPAISLEQITVNQKHHESDISGVTFNSNDQAFKLRASRNGNDKLGRVYTIIYRATDAMGNATEESIDITVPHDKSK
jgi:hypothetical protein